MQLSLEWSKKLAGQKHRGKDFGVVFLDVFLLPEFRSGASFSPKNHAEPVLNRMTLLVLNCTIVLALLTDKNLNMKVLVYGRDTSRRSACPAAASQCHIIF